MKKVFVTLSIIILNLHIKAQTISNLEYSLAMEINDHFPSNLSTTLSKKGFVLLEEGSNEEEVSFEYALKKYDKYFYHVTLSKIGGMQQIVLRFNNNSKTSEFDPFVAAIKKFMVLQPKINGSLHDATIYKDNSGYYYAYVAHPDKNYYMIAILNYSAFYELHLKQSK